jgi:hypothetical protein
MSTKRIYPKRTISGKDRSERIISQSKSLLLRRQPTSQIIAVVPNVLSFDAQRERIRRASVP